MADAEREGKIDPNISGWKAEDGRDELYEIH